VVHLSACKQLKVSHAQEAHVFCHQVTSKEHVIWTVKTLAGIPNNSSLVKVTAKNNLFSALNSINF
jgi:hypothetical protein